MLNSETLRFHVVRKKAKCVPEKFLLLAALDASVDIYDVIRSNDWREHTSTELNVACTCYLWKMDVTHE